MRFFILLLLLTVSSVANLKPQDTTVRRTPEYQQEIDQLIKRDAENKRWARIYLREIDAAIRNNDIPAYVFFVREFEKIPLEIVPGHLRSEPGYATPIGDLELAWRLRWWEQAIQIFLKYKMSTH